MKKKMALSYFKPPFSFLCLNKSSVDIENYLYILVALKRAVLTGELGVIEIEIRHVHRGYDEPIGYPSA
jgi:hypothetical protein